MPLPIVALVTCLALTSGCQESATAPDQPVYREVVLAPGQGATISEASIRIQFDGVVSDNRCPVDVDCIQAGDAVVQISVSGEAGGGEYQLHTASPQFVRHGDLTITLVQLRPQPTSSGPIRPEDYRATLRVTR